MKKINIVLFVLMVSCIGLVNAQQRVAVIDTKYILEKLPEYKEAQGKINELSYGWQQDIEAAQMKLDNMRKDFEAEQVMLSPELLKKREIEIQNKDIEIREMQRKKFGFEGELFKKRAELIKPVQDRVYAAVQKLAQNGAYDLVLDKSAGITVIFADPKLDKSEEVLRSLGVK
jgi:outer membrane protein